MSQATAGNLQQLLAQMMPDSPPKKVLSGDPHLAYAALVDTDKLNAGVWSSTVGSWEIEAWSVNEVMLFISGRVRLTHIDGTVTELGEGDVFYVPKGWQGRWETLADMQKFYVIVP